MSGGPRGGGGRGGRGRRGGGGPARGGRANSSGPASGPQPVEFHLFASEAFDMAGCPAQVRPPTAPGALRRLTMANRSVLGDIVYWFCAKAFGDPQASLVMWQATREDKNWLSSYAAEHTPDLEVSMLETGSNKYMQFMLRPGATPSAAPAASAAAAAALGIGPAAPNTPPQPDAAVPPPPPPKPAADAASGAPAEAAAAPAPKGTQVQHAKEVIAEAGHKAGTAAAAVAGKVKETVAEKGEQAKEVAAAVACKTKEVASAAGSQVAAAGQKAAEATKAAATAAKEGVKEAYAEGNNQALVIGGAAAAALAAVGIVLGVVLGRRKTR